MPNSSPCLKNLFAGHAQNKDIVTFTPMPEKPSIEELENDPKYEKVLTLPYSDIASFVIQRIKPVSLPVIFIWFITCAAAFSMIWFWPGLIYETGRARILAGLTYGFAVLPLALIPFHEALHLIPLSLSGARDIRFGMDLSQGIVYVTAHRYVIGRKMFTIVALTPSVIVTAGLITAMFFCPLWWKWVLSMTLFTHSTMCAGDAAMLSYTRSQRNRELYTWDDVDRREAYFFASRI